MSNQIVTTGEHDDTRRWVCPNCGNQDMRSQLDEQVGLQEEITVHKTTIRPPQPPTEDSSSLKKD